VKLRLLEKLKQVMPGDLAGVQMYDNGTTGQMAGIVVEPIQGWARSIFPPEDYFPKLRRWCDARGILLMAGEVLTMMTEHPIIGDVRGKG
jgi:4-aminobutyrate aminotransferase-like enzyme